MHCDWESKTEVPELTGTWVVGPGSRARLCGSRATLAARFFPKGKPHIVMRMALSYGEKETLPLWSSSSHPWRPSNHEQQIRQSQTERFFRVPDWPGVGPRNGYF